MRGLMMDEQLTITSLMRHGQQLHGDSTITSITVDHARHQYTFSQCFERVAQLANALHELGFRADDFIGTLAWNDFRHMEIYYASGCAGGVCHTVNPRLFPDQLVYIINHAEDKWLFVDPMFLPILEQLASQLPTVQGYIVLCQQSHMPSESSLPNLYCYEDLLAAQSTQYDWPDLSEDTACSLCYTSGTTGNPKGVLYSHRSLVLQTYAASSGSAMGVTDEDTILPVVPMFHVNAWNIPYLASMAGFNLVYPGSKMGDGETLARLINEEKVNFAAGVPTVWLALLNYLRDSGTTLPSLKGIGVGGAACPLSTMEAFQNEYGISSHPGWGMTEMAPMGTYNSMNVDVETVSEEEFTRLRQSAGKPIFGVRMKIVGADEKELPWDGEAFGALKVKGPWVIKNYFKRDEKLLDEDGWFDTGDVATIDSKGNMTITDRTKDVIKSGGEWISSIDLENCAIAHPAVSEAAVIGIVHPKWDERPLLVVVRAAEEEVSAAEIIEFMQGKVAKWWMPDAVEFVDELPHTATGKVHKVGLREQFKDFRFAGA